MAACALATGGGWTYADFMWKSGKACMQITLRRISPGIPARFAMITAIDRKRPEIGD
jgi:hypothetical protein